MLLGLLLTVCATATEVPKMNVVTIDDSITYVVAVTSPLFASEVFVTASDGRVVYYKKSKAADNFKSILNLSHLEDGVYTLKLKTGKGSTQSYLEVNKGRIAVKKMQAKMDPFFSYDGKMLILSYLNYSNNNISILLYNGSELVFESRLGNDFNIQRAFDVSKLVKGDFNFVLDGSNQFYSYKIAR